MKRSIVILLFWIVVLCGCRTTHYVYPELPEYDVQMPDRPQLESTSEVVPVEVNRNTVKLITYVQQLESYIDNLKAYYHALPEIWRNENAKD